MQKEQLDLKARTSFVQQAGEKGMERFMTCSDS
jgi:hypothetical protein